MGGECETSPRERGKVRTDVLCDDRSRRRKDCPEGVQENSTNHHACSVAAGTRRWARGRVREMRSRKSRDSKARVLRVDYVPRVQSDEDIESRSRSGGGSRSEDERKLQCDDAQIEQSHSLLSVSILRFVSERGSKTRDVAEEEERVLVTKTTKNRFISFWL